MTIPSCFTITSYHYIPDAEGATWDPVDSLNNLDSSKDVLIEIVHQTHKDEFHVDDEFNNPFKVQLYFSKGSDEWKTTDWGLTKYWTKNEPNDPVDTKMFELAKNLLYQNPTRYYNDLAYLTQEFCKWCCDGPNPAQQIADRMEP